MEKMEPGSDNEPLSQNICSKTQFKIQHINHEMKTSVITHIFETELVATTKLAHVLNHLSEREK